MSRKISLVLVGLTIIISFFGLALAGDPKSPLDYFPKGKKLQGKQNISTTIKDADLGSRVVTFLVNEDGTVSVTMTEVPVQHKTLKNIAARSFTSSSEQLVGTEFPAIKVTDPKDGGKFTFIYKEGSVWLEGGTSGGTRKSDCQLK